MATLLPAGRAVNDLWALAVLIGITVAVGCACAIAFLLAEKVARALGVTGSIVLARLLAALAVQFVIDGLRTAFGEARVVVRSDFEAGLKVDVARGAVDACLADAGRFVLLCELRPLLGQLLPCVLFVSHAGPADT